METKDKMKEHIKEIVMRYGKTLSDVCKSLDITRNSLFVKLKNESIKVSYLPELAEAIGCSPEELILPSDGFEHRYTKGGKYLGIHKIKIPA